VRRTVKAWVIRRKGATDAPFKFWEGCRVEQIVKASSHAFDGERAVPVEITYDDGRPAPRKRTKGKKGGRRG